MRKSIKISLLSIGGLALSTIAVLGFVLSTFNNDDYRKSLIFLVDHLTDCNIEIVEPFSCEISAAPKFDMAGLKLFRPETTDPLAFQNLKLELKLPPLLRGQLHMKVATQIKEPKTLKWLLPKELLALDSVALTTELFTDTSTLNFQNLKVDGRNKQGLALKLTGAGLIEDFSAQQPLSKLNLLIKVDAPESRSLHGYLPDDLPEMGPVKGSLRLIAISPSALAAKDINLDFGRKDKLYVQAKGEISNIPVDPKIINTDIDFHLSLQAAETKALEKLLQRSLPEIGPVTAEVDFRGSQEKFNLNNFSGHFGKTTMTADIEGSFAGALPQITGKIVIPTLFPDDFLEPANNTLAEPKTSASDKDKLPDHKDTNIKKHDQTNLFSRRPFPRNWLHKFNCDIHLVINNIEGFQKNLKDLEMRVNLNSGKLSVNPAKLIFRDGYTQISLFVDDTGSIPEVKLECDLDDLDLTDLLTYFDASSPVAGKLTAHVQMSSQGLSLHDLAANLSGNFGTALEKGVVPNHILKLIAVDLLGWSFDQALMKKKYAEINCCVLSLMANQGKLEIRPFIFDSDNLTITGAGTIDLETETCDLTLYPKKKRKFWAMITPVTISGSLRDPLIIAIPVKKAALLYGGVLLAPQFFLPAIGINYLWEMVAKDGEDVESPCLEYLHQQSLSQPESQPQPLPGPLPAPQ